MFDNTLIKTVILIRYYQGLERMNKFFLDEDRVIEADMSSDASPIGDELIHRSRDVNLRDLGFHFSRYCHELKREFARHLSTISRDFNLLTSCFLDENLHNNLEDPLKIIAILKSWVPRLLTFEDRFREVKSSMPYLPTEKRRPPHDDSRGIKFIDILERIITKYQGPLKQENSTNAVAETASKIQLSAHINRIQALHDEGKYEQSIARCKEQLAILESPQVHFILANSYKSLGSYREAIEEYGKAVKLVPRACYFNNRGNAYLSMGSIDKAERDYKTAIELEPKNEVFLGNYGNICLSSKKFKEAIEMYNRAIAIDPGNDFFYNNRAFAEIKLGEMNAAIDSYNQAIDLNPNNHIYLKNRANLFMEKAMIKRALEDISKAINIEPKHQYYFLKGKWEYRSGRPHDAMNSFRKACQLEPNKEQYQKFFMAIRAELGYK